MRHLIIVIAFISFALIAGGCNPSMFGGLYGMYGQPYPQYSQPGYGQQSYAQPQVAGAYPQQPQIPPSVPAAMPGAEFAGGGGGYASPTAATLPPGPTGRAFMHQEDLEVAGGPRYNEVMGMSPAFRHVLVIRGVPYALVPTMLNGRVGIPQNRGMPLRVPTANGSSEPTIPAVCPDGRICTNTNYVPILLEESGPLRMQFECWAVDRYGRFPARRVGRTPIYNVWDPARDPQTLITDESCGAN